MYICIYVCMHACMYVYVRKRNINVYITQLNNTFLLFSSHDNTSWSIVWNCIHTYNIYLYAFIYIMYYYSLVIV